MMKVYRLQGFALALAGVFLSLGLSVMAQQGSSSASVSRSQAITTSNLLSKDSQKTGYYGSGATFTPPDEVAVEEFINYHKHRLLLPKVGQNVALDTRWGNDEISSNQREAVLQIGFTTAEVNERTDLRPLNLVLVIDHSGSMAASDKMSRVKASLHTMIGKLRPQDCVSIVIFDSTAKVLVPAGSIGDGYNLRRAIDSIQPAGSTNIHSGLMLGYKEALKNFQKNASNRVILLTDGIANQGVTDPKQIAAESSEYNGQGIDLSTIGVGLDLNNDLLRTLAVTGRGLYHFVSDEKDIEKVFVTEVQSLISSVAKKVEVKVDYDSNLEIEKVYGYKPSFSKNNISIALENMNSGLTQVVMMRFKVKNLSKNTYPVKVKLSYFDIKQQKMVEQVQELYLKTSRLSNNDLLADVEVKKNYTIAQLSQSLADMTESAKAKKYLEAENLLNTSITESSKRYPNMEDKDIRFILNIVEGYQRDITAFNKTQQNRDCGKCP